MSKTKIEWTDITINPIVGCLKCSPGCQNCYAEKFAARLAKNPKTATKYAGVVDENGHWSGQFSQPSFADFRKLPKSPRRVFVGSMTDIFHDEIVKGREYHKTWLPILFDAMFSYPQHTFLLLTKRPENMKDWIDFTLEQCVDKPLPNAWLGVTVCNQEEADAKIPVLLDIPAAKRFVSIEPMLGQVDLQHIHNNLGVEINVLSGSYRWYAKETPESQESEQILLDGPKLDWVIAGGETGSNVRAVHPDWVRYLRDQCLDTGTPFFFKSWGEWLPISQMDDDFEAEKYPVGHIEIDGLFYPPPSNDILIRNNSYGEDTIKVGKKQSGHLIDGVEYRQFPNV